MSLRKKKKDTGNFEQIFVSKTKRLLLEKTFIFNFYSSSPTTGFFLTCICPIYFMTNFIIKMEDLHFGTKEKTMKIIK
jgi:hypothetical protein